MRHDHAAEIEHQRGEDALHRQLPLHRCSHGRIMAQARPGNLSLDKPARRPYAFRSSAASPELPAMSRDQKHVTFSGRMVIVGFGSIGQGVLPLLLRHIDIAPSQITIVTAEERGHEEAASSASASGWSR